MDTIKIDDKEYKFSDLSEEARAQLLSLQATDAKIAELQRDMAIAQTARMAYARALNELLPVAATSHWVAWNLSPLGLRLGLHLKKRSSGRFFLAYPSQ